MGYKEVPLTRGKVAIVDDKDFVGWDKERGKYQAYARVNGIRRMLGRFEDPKQAARIRDAFVKEHHGEFARLNFG